MAKIGDFLDRHTQLCLLRLLLVGHVVQTWYTQHMNLNCELSEQKPAQLMPPNLSLQFLWWEGQTDLE